MIRLLHTGDIHLGAPFDKLGDFATSRRADILATFNRILDTARSESVDAVLIAGDLFDTSPTTADLAHQVAEALNALVRDGIPAVLIPGTHDHLIPRDNPYSAHLAKRCPNLTLFLDALLDEPITLSLGTGANSPPVNFYGIAHAVGPAGPALESMRRRETLPGLHVGLLHCSLKGDPSWELHQHDLPVSPEDLDALGLDYVAMGHYHRQQVVDVGSRTVAAYCGSPEGTKMTETGTRTVNIVELTPMDNDRAQVSVSIRPVNTREIVDTDIDCGLVMSRASDGVDSEADAIERIVNAVRQQLGGRELAEIILRLRLTGVVSEPLAPEQLEARLRTECAYAEVLDKTNWVTGADAQALAREDTLRGHFLREITAKLDAATDARDKAVLQRALTLVLAEFNQAGLDS